MKAGEIQIVGLLCLGGRQGHGWREGQGIYDLTMYMFCVCV